MWAEVVFWILIVPLLIALFIIYIKSKRMYRLMYILSVFTYSMTIMYTIDAYDLGKNPILGLLAFSAALMMLIGYHFHKPLQPPFSQPSKRRKR